MNKLYYLAFMLGFSTAGLSMLEKLNSDFTTYRTEMRDISVATPTATCDRALSRNFCSNFIK